MSVDIYKYDDNIYDDADEIVSEVIASQRIYDKYLSKAIKELGIAYLQDGAELRIENLEKALSEIQLLIDWIQAYVKGEDRMILSERLDHIRSVIKDSLKTKDDIL